MFYKFSNQALGICAASAACTDFRTQASFHINLLLFWVISSNMNNFLKEKGIDSVPNVMYVTQTIQRINPNLDMQLFSSPLALEVSIQLSSRGLATVNKLLIDALHILPLCQNNTKTT